MQTTGDVQFLMPVLLLALLLVLVSVSETEGAHGEPEEAKERKPTSHPFLICTHDQFPALRERARREPWAAMKTDALRQVARGYSPDDLRGSVARLQRFLGACALAYILEPEQHTQHAGRIHEAVVDHLADVEFNEELKWIGVVPPMATAFVATIALDIAHNDLSAAQREACESVIAEQIGKIRRNGAWPLARYGTHGTWDIYTGKRTTPDDGFYRRYMQHVTEDGVVTTATSYAWARLASGDSRPQKTAYADVLEFTGLDRRYYNNARLRKFYRWLYACSLTPARQVHAFGDFIPQDARNSALAWRTGRFDSEAARYMAWALEEHEPPGHVLAYILTHERHEPLVPGSRLYADGGAFLREPEDSADSLGAALYNIRADAMWHAHQETNAISLSAYGARLLMNGGWLGPPTRPARLNNTLTVNGRDHDSRSGAGLQEGLTSGGLDYAAGLSGNALPDGASFVRGLVLVHGEDQANGYFVVVDEVTARPGDHVHHYVHPSTNEQPEVRSPETEYDAAITLFNEVTSTHLTVFYGSKPDKVTRELVPSGSERARREKHYRLAAVHPVDKQGRAQLVTVLFPHDPRHQKAELSRIEDGNGVLVRQKNGVSDYVRATDGATEYAAPAGVRFQARMVLFRQTGGSVTFYLARHAVRFRGQNIGFDSTAPISVHMRGANGRISAASEAQVTFHHPVIREVRLNGRPLATLNEGAGWRQVRIPPVQNQAIKLITDDGE